MNAHNQKVIDFRGNIVPLVDLKEIFEMPEEQVREKISIQLLSFVKAIS